MRQYQMRFVWAPGEADMCLPHEALQAQIRLSCSPQDVVVVANDYDYCFQGGAFQLALLQRQTKPGACWTVTPDTLLQQLNICRENAIWLAVLADNDYSRRGLHGVSLTTACNALAQQEPLTLDAVLELPHISYVWSRYTVDQQSVMRAELENATLALGAYVSISEPVTSRFEIQLHLLPCLNNSHRETAEEEHAYHTAVNASELVAGKVVIIWGVAVSVPQNIR